MAGTKAGGLKTAATNKQKFGDNYYREIGRKGGKNGHSGGFAANPTLARLAGTAGGRASRRGSEQEAARLRLKIVKLYSKGLAQVEIARKYNISATAVHYHLDKAGVL